MTPVEAQPRPSTELHRRRERLAEEAARLQWDLGGLAYEMAVRDHFRLDVLVARAAILQQRKEELAKLDRELERQPS